MLPRPDIEQQPTSGSSTTVSSRRLVVVVAPGPPGGSASCVQLMSVRSFDGERRHHLAASPGRLEGRLEPLDTRKSIVDRLARCLGRAVLPIALERLVVAIDQRDPLFSSLPS